MRTNGGGISNSIFGFCAPCSVAGLVVLSWMPGLYMMRTGVLSGEQEHFLAYLLSAMLIAAVRPRVPLASAIVLYILLAGVLELGQSFVPGRHPALFDFVASSAGAVCAGAILALMRRALRVTEATA